MNEEETGSQDAGGFLFCNLSPFLLAIIVACGFFMGGSTLAGLLLFAGPLGLAASIVAIVIAWRKGHNLSQKLTSAVLNGLAVAFFGFQTASLVFLLVIGFPCPN